MAAKNRSAPAASHSGEHHHHAPATGGPDAGALVDMKGLKQKMERSLHMLEKDFAGIRGGKPDPGVAAPAAPFQSNYHTESL